MPNVAPLLAYLQQLQQQGHTRVLLDEEARAVLRARYLADRNHRPAPAPARSAKQPPPPPTPPPPAPPPPTPAALPTLQVHGDTPAEQLASLKGQAADWAPARSLGTLRDRMVFAVGNPSADLMFVGEAPGFQEELRGEPFVGKAGEKFDQILKAMGFSRETVYISNICKFRPATANQTTNNRKPNREEIAACLPFVRAEIAIVKPKCIVALGATAAEGLLDRVDPVSRLRGSWHEFEGVPVRVTYHPSYLLHNEGALREKRKVWDDMLSILEYLEIPISKKQLGFFSGK